jgi:hypothetical protein
VYSAQRPWRRFLEGHLMGAVTSQLWSTPTETEKRSDLIRNHLLTAAGYPSPKKSKSRRDAFSIIRSYFDCQSIGGFAANG